MDKVYGESRLSFGNTSFALVGILQHLGNGVNSGHYITTFRVGECWQIRNDSIGEEFTQLPGAENDLWSNAYVYVYQQIWE